MPATKAYAHYQNIRHRLPQEPQGNRQARHVAGLLEIAQDFDTFFFDAYGVLNVGSTAITDAPEVVAELQKQGKSCFVVSNAASFEKRFYLEKYRKLGFNFTEDTIITSRDALLQGLATYPLTLRWGCIGPAESQKDLRERGVQCIDQDDADFLHADGYLFFSPLRWDEARQSEFVASLLESPRPILLGNPDLIAPLGNGKASIEAGSYVLTIEESLFPQVTVFGKPFPAIYDIAKTRLIAQGQAFNPQRTLMLGDTLHTDILGGNAYGIATALVYGHGFFRDLDYRVHIQDSGIIPTFVMPQM